MKRTRKLLTQILFTCFLFSLFSCGADTHAHSYSSTYSYDQNNHWKECSCGEKSELGSHTFDSGVTITVPTETSTGLKKYTCTICQKTKTEEIPKLIHTHSYSSTYSSDQNYHWKECSCGEKSELGSHTFDSGVIITVPTETSTGLKKYTCTICQKTKTEEMPKLIHTHSAVTSYYYDNDIHYQLCSCGEKMNVGEHDFDNGVITKEPTTTSSGEKTFTCKICGKTKIETIKPISKNYGTMDDPISVSEALDVAKSDIKKDGEVTKKEIYCFGEVSSIGTKTSYGYQNVYVKDNSNDVLIYTINVDSSYSINVGDVIYFHGYIKMYDDILEFATFNDGKKSYYVTLYDVKQETKDLCFSINSSTFDYYASYDTNFDSVDIYSNNLKATFTTYNFDTESTSSSFIKLIAVKNYNNVETLGGYIGNLTAFYNIKKVDISYSCNTKATFTYGNDYECSSKLEMSSTSSAVNKFSVDGTKNSFKYFKIQADTSDVHIKSIDIYFGSLGNKLTSRSKISSASKFNLSSYVVKNPTEGQKVSVPYSFNSSGDVLSSKTFTYYSFSYVNAHKNSLNLNSIALTDPRDVATYYTIFNRIPCNFAKKNAQSYDPEEFVACGSLNDVKNIFGSNTRYVSKYDSTTGYMKSIPYNTYSGSKPLYYEFDIKLDSYSTSSRGEGRVVGVAKGLNCYNNNNNVCFYTDDHYATFQEYLNNGNFASRFDTDDKNVFATGKSYNSQALF